MNTLASGQESSNPYNDSVIGGEVLSNDLRVPALGWPNFQPTLIIPPMGVPMTSNSDGFSTNVNFTAAEGFDRDHTMTFALSSPRLETTSMIAPPSLTPEPIVTDSQLPEEDIASGVRNPQKPKGYATSQDWEKHRPLIENLYRYKQLWEIIQIMETEHGFRATSVIPTPLQSWLLTIRRTNMYKKRFTAWKLGKYHRESEMKAIVRKEHQRVKQGKLAPRYRIRRQVVHYRDVIRYYEKKKLSIDDVVAQRKMSATPETLEVITPVPSPVTTPEVLAIPEQILRSIRNYYIGSFESRMWTWNKLTLRCSTAKDQRDGFLLLRKLLIGCRTAVRLLRRNDAQEAGQVLLAATVHTKSILECEHPCTLESLFSMVTHFVVTNRCELGSLIMRQFYDLGGIIIGPKHPVSLISGWLATMDSPLIRELVVVCCHVSARTFEMILGPTGPQKLTAWKAYAEVLETLGENKKARTLMATIHSQREAEINPPTTRRLKLRILLAHQHFVDGQPLEALKLTEAMMSIARKLRSQRQRDRFFAETLAMQARSLFALGHFLAGESNLRKAIDVRISKYGIHDERAKRWLMRLENGLMKDRQFTRAAEVRAEWIAMLDPKDLE